MKKIAQQQCRSKSFWLTVTYIHKQNLVEKLRSDLGDFHIIKDELKVPLRNTASISAEAYKQGDLKVQFNQTKYLDKLEQSF